MRTERALMLDNLPNIPIVMRRRTDWLARIGLAILILSAAAPAYPAGETSLTAKAPPRTSAMGPGETSLTVQASLRAGALVPGELLQLRD
ncbi:MAG: hypothetical protein NTX50_12900, partial [Candidatus Sumerlaeota bacterium]|nr:hypothetical protein [Candidatus Sumerlaeota bacterium]